MSRGRRIVTLAGAVLLSTSLTACQGTYDVSLPGGGAGGPSYHVTVELADALDLVPQSAVKVDDVTVGSVEGIELDGWTARVRLRVQDHVRLPDNATAELKQTSLLGEKYVALEPPTGAKPVGRLSDGDVIPLSRSGRSTEVEEVLGALSLLLNGGGVAQLKTIETELNAALHGNESTVRDLLHRLDDVVGSLDAQKSEIVRAIDSIDDLSATLSKQRDDIATALDDLPAGLKVLADQRRQLTTMLTALSDLGDVGSRVILASTADTVANLKALQPVLSKLNEAGDSLPASLELLLTYPFPDRALDAMKGDYTNLHLTMDLDARSLLSLAGLDVGDLGSRLPGVTTLPDLSTVPGLENLPGAGDLRGLPRQGGGDSETSGRGPTLPALPGLPTSLSTPLPGLPGGTSPSSPAPGGVLDPGLLGLLLGGLATGGQGAQR
ncbi:MAG TPA: MCE family protein [Actinomycetales bacterium]|nr:MCE family protein [Actinomycetales bacterium]